MERSRSRLKRSFRAAFREAEAEGAWGMMLPLLMEAAPAAGDRFLEMLEAKEKEE